MKRKYQKPTMEVVLINNYQCLLQGTGGNDSGILAPRYDPVNDPEDLLNFEILTY
jgi:hypothetical protein